ncbi:MAG: polysaccharide deacetylase family protein [Bacteroidia bacterium]|jgi:peptidoglycan/xylan/chitin deacetylase (PgdA/CDA1 family)|nr:polysaccharide deacetylase family protein [Bacteroidia bacterium]
MSKKYATLLEEAVPVPTEKGLKIREFFRTLLLSSISFTGRKNENCFLRCLYCHYVFDDQREDFEAVLTELRKIGKFIDTDTCVQMVQGTREIDGKYFHLSFDDGFRNNYTNAFPILKKLSIPAIFFVPSALISASYEDTKTYCLDTAKYGAVIEMMHWEDLQEIRSIQGFEIGSHTRTHARFSDISRNISLLQSEICGSKTDLEKNLDFECKYISWPFGCISDVDEESLRMVMDCGYIACFGAFRGSVKVGLTSVYSIPRHHFEAQWPISHTKYFAYGNMENRN